MNIIQKLSLLVVVIFIALTGVAVAKYTETFTSNTNTLSVDAMGGKQGCMNALNRMEQSDDLIVNGQDFNSQKLKEQFCSFAVMNPQIVNYFQ